MFPTERQGRLLCSPRDPDQEAARWISKQPLVTSDSHIVVLGFGAGFHIKSLRREYRALPMTVFESEQEIVELATNQASTVDVQHLSSDNLARFVMQTRNPILVLCFRPSWALREHLYMDAFLFLTARSESHLQTRKKLLGHDRDLRAQTIWSLVMELPG